MRNLDVGALPVCDGGKLVGMVTDRDIVIRSVARGDEPRKKRAADVMTADLVWCYSDENLDDVSRKMCDKQVRRIPVLDRDKKLVGMVSLGDLAKSSGDAGMTSHALEEISRPAKGKAAGSQS